MNNLFDKSSLPQFTIPKMPDFDPDEFAPNRTAKITEKTVELLQAMTENMKNEAAAQHKRFLVETVLSVLAILVASIAALASLAPFFPALANVLQAIVQ